MKKIVSYCLMLTLGLSVVACGGADLGLPPVSENPNPPANPPQDPPNNIPEVEAVPTPEICAVDDEDCGHDLPEIGIYTPPVYTTKPDYEIEIVSPHPAQINPCLEDPEAEGCE